MEIMKLSPGAMAQGFTQDLGIDIYEDTQGMGRVGTRLVALDQDGSSTLHITDNNGSDYYIACVNYQRKHKAVSKRTIAVIMSGFHTRCAYWPKGSKPRKISIHKGKGYFIVGDPSDRESDGFNTHYFPVEEGVTPAVVLQPGNFYAFEAAPGCTLTVSAMEEVDDDGHIKSFEIPVEPGQTEIKAPEGLVQVPDEFVNAEFE
jgi:hypothetical protein